MLVPLIYLVMTLGRIKAGSYAVTTRPPAKPDVPSSRPSQGAGRGGRRCRGSGFRGGVRRPGLRRHGDDGDRLLGLPVPHSAGAGRDHGQGSRAPAPHPGLQPQHHPPRDPTLTEQATLSTVDRFRGVHREPYRAARGEPSCSTGLFARDEEGRRSAPPRPRLHDDLRAAHLQRGKNHRDVGAPVSDKEPRCHQRRGTGRAANALDDPAYGGGVGEAVPSSATPTVQQASGRPPSRGDRCRPGCASGGSAHSPGTPDGRTAVVALTGEAELPMIGPALRELGVSVRISVESHARSDIR